MAKKHSPGQKLKRKLMGDKTYDSLHFLGTAAEQQYDATKAAEKAVKEAENEPVIPLPDEEEIARVNRRRSRRNTGRASTIMTDYEGLGG